MPETDHTSSDTSESGTSERGHSRPKPGERRIQILQALAEMLEQPGGERITTAGLAARLQVRCVFAGGTSETSRRTSCSALTTKQTPFFGRYSYAPTGRSSQWAWSWQSNCGST